MKCPGFSPIVKYGNCQLSLPDKALRPCPSLRGFLDIFSGRQMGGKCLVNVLDTIKQREGDYLREHLILTCGILF